jgi:hypothetical protein
MITRTRPVALAAGRVSRGLRSSLIKEFVAIEEFLGAGRENLDQPMPVVRTST